VPSTHCAPPFCYDFRATAPATSVDLNGIKTAAKCAATTTEMAAVLAPLEHIYPCHATHPDSWTADGSHHNSSTAYSTAEAKLCNASYDIMGQVVTRGTGFGDFSVVPECSPDALDMYLGFHTSCGTCTPTLCPAHEHFVTPLYKPSPDIISVAEETLANQQAIMCREMGGGATAAPPFRCQAIRSRACRPLSLTNCSRPRR